MQARPRLGIAAVACLLAGCGRLGFGTELADAGDPIDGAADAVLDAACSTGPWSAPVSLSSIDTAANEYSPALSADGLTLIFESDRAGTNGGDDLYQATRASLGDAFGSATPLTTLNSSGFDTAPTLTLDGLTLYFASDRSGAYQIYRATRPSTAVAFGSPMLVPGLSAYDARGPAISAGGDELIFNDGPLLAIHRATIDENGTATVISELTEVEQPGVQSGYASLSRDGRTIYFESTRDGHSTADLYTAVRSAPGQPFAAPVRLDALASDVDNDQDPEISKNDLVLVFARGQASVNADLWIATRTCD